MPRLFLSASPLSTFSSAWFPMLRFQFSVLGALFVSFHPSRFRSHSRSTGAPRLPLPLVRFRFGFSACFPLSFVRFSPLLTTQLSAHSFPVFPIPPAAVSRFIFPLPSSLLPCFPSDSGTQPSAIPFALAVLPHSGYLSGSTFFLAASGRFPLAFALGSGYLASGSHPFRGVSRSFRTCRPEANLDILSHRFPFVNHFFQFFQKIF